MKILLLVAVFSLLSLHAFASCEFVQRISDSVGNSISEFSDTDNPGTNAALILPPTGGENIADKFLAVSLCQRGLNTLILNFRQDSAEIDDLSAHDRITNGVLLWVDELLAKRKENFVIIGASLGSIYASMAFGEARNSSQTNYPNLRKIQGAVLTVSGGSLAEILASSGLASLVKERNARLLHFAFADTSQYQKALESAITLDQLQLVDPTASNKVLMFSSTNDKIVPTKTQNQLWEAWGRPERHLYFTDHMWTIGFVYFTQPQKIYDFSQRIFNSN